MNLEIDYVNFVEMPYDLALVEDVVRTTMSLSDYAKVLSGRRISLSVAVLSASEMQKANTRLRGKDTVTDVISVGDYADELSIEDDVTESEIIDLGEILLCWDFIRDSVTIQGITVRYEVCYVLSHGTLHLLGYDHCPRMYDIQESVAEKLS